MEILYQIWQTGDSKWILNPFPFIQSWQETRPVESYRWKLTWKPSSCFVPLDTCSHPLPGQRMAVVWGWLQQVSLWHRHPQSKTQALKKALWSQGKGYDIWAHCLFRGCLQRLSWASEQQPLESELYLRAINKERKKKKGFFFFFFREKRKFICQDLSEWL